MSPPPPFTVSMGDYSLTPPDAEDNLSHTVDSAMKWSTATSVGSENLYAVPIGFSVVTVVLIIAIIAIACAIVKCLKRAPTMSVIPSQIQISTTDHKASNNKKEIALAIPADSDSQEEMEFATMERFLNNINQEKPIRFSPEELKQITNNYTTIFGSGAFGVVYKGELPNEEKVAVKVLNGMDLGTEEQFKAEVSTIGRTYRINLVRLYGFCFHSDKRALVYEFVPNGSLYSLLFGSLNTHVVEFGKLHEIAMGTAKGIAYLHEECQHRIIHYDIKPENILLGLNLEPKVADFGLAKLCSRESSHVNMSHFRGTRGYAAPELWKLYPTNHKCDIYSFGIVLFEIVGRRRHFDSGYGESQQWLPKWAWDMFENNELPMMLSLFGIGEEERGKAERKILVALWCAQYLPTDRPLMSNVVKMLEGDIKISPPATISLSEFGVF